MFKPILDHHLLDELNDVLSRGMASGDFIAPDKIRHETMLFSYHFGPDKLQKLNGSELLALIHGRDKSESRCLAYWLEFKNDEEFSGSQFGGIGGGSALKFGIYQRKGDNAWITGPPKRQRILSLSDAIDMVKKQCDELLAGAEVISKFVPSDSSDISDEIYASLQAAIQHAAPNLADAGWAHKYWFLINPDRLDSYHSPRYQRFHLLKLLQMPPDRIGILNSTAPRFVCGGRFIRIARELDVPVTTLAHLLNRHHGTFHRYWRVGTTEGENGESLWPEMRKGGFVSIGWRDQISDLTDLIREEKNTAKDRIRDKLLLGYGNSGTAMRKAGEILNFANEIAEEDLVLACEGQTVLGVGRICGPYEYVEKFRFPHLRPVEWLLIDPWQLPEQEGLKTTVYELGRSAVNLLELEQRLSLRKPKVDARLVAHMMKSRINPLPPLDPLSARVSSVLKRKGQVALYGPPGTGKTYRAFSIAKELASREAFRKTFADLSESEKSVVADGNGLVRLCTFHPGWGYEDFIEGLRPKTVNGQMLFEARDGVFKRICLDAAMQQDRHFFLVVDEINRGDLPRIFGELLTTIEYDKRGLCVTLPITGSSFSVPRNVFLIGTMNTADRSISLMDAALRRRFGFVELLPDSSLLAGHKAGGLQLGPWLDALNLRLRRHLKRDARNLQIGHAYLMSPRPITSVAEFARVLRDDIIPLLEEYCYDDFDMLREILGRDLVDVEAGRIREEIFDVHREEDLIQAVSFEEMEPLILDQAMSDSALIGASSDIATGEGDNDEAANAER